MLQDLFNLSIYILFGFPTKGSCLYASGAFLSDLLASQASSFGRPQFVSLYDSKFLLLYKTGSSFCGTSGAISP